MPNNGANEKKAKINLSNLVFGTASATAIEAMSFELLESGLKRIRIILSVPENTPENMATGKILEPPPEDVPDFELTPAAA